MSAPVPLTPEQIRWRWQELTEQRNRLAHQIRIALANGEHPQTLQLLKIQLDQEWLRFWNDHMEDLLPWP